MSLRRSVVALLVLFGAVRSIAGQDVPHRTIPDLRWQPVAIGAGIVGLTMFFDAEIARGVKRHGTAGSRETARTLSKFGEVVVIGPVAGGLAAIGLLAGKPQVTRTAGRVAASIVVANLLTQPVKFLAGRRRPYQDTNLDASDFSPFSGHASFPSGHSSAAFALATTLGDATGNTFARIGLYALATGTAWGRVTEADHWVSDVLAGAGIGILSAKFASGKFRILGLQAPRFLIGPQGTGIAMTASLPRIR
ncbi:MAG: phosphatase PAP2 family protein [Gemmatimonadales bacterium]